MLKKICSGAQTGADIAGLVTAKEFGLETGGWIPKGWKTLSGSKPEYAELYGIQEHSSTSYKPRTWFNARDSDGTIRLAFNFQSAGEICTLNGVKHHKKPHIDVDLANPRPHQEVIDWINENNIETLNVAGNAEQTCIGTYAETCEYLAIVFSKLGFGKV